jgi:hypothetical protein
MHVLHLKVHNSTAAEEMLFSLYMKVHCHKTKCLSSVKIFISYFFQSRVNFRLILMSSSLENFGLQYYENRYFSYPTFVLHVQLAIINNTLGKHITIGSSTLMCILYTGLFISPSGISELYCATTKTDTAERSISIDINRYRISPSFFLY